MYESATHAAVEDLARNSYGRLIAFLASRSGDVAGAEDALSEAFVAALEKWPMDGVPEKPEAWLLRVARNRLIDAARHNQVRQDSGEFLQQVAEEAQTVAEIHEQGIVSGQQIIVITWLHEAERESLKVHPRGEVSAPLVGVFSTRSPDRPNPLGLHRVTVREVVDNRVRIGPIEAIDGTPITDIKPVLPESTDS